ncbi:MAG: bifunctional DNA-formamidopyrimidine glycosylase/DNA-(apurinic or apyrimidinic site) lyase [Nitriliruptoraceae bacterium]
MPELPEVESVRKQLEPALVARSIVDVWWDRHPHSRFHHVDRARGSTVTAVRRRGKFLIVALASPARPWEMLLHLGMSGSLRFSASSDEHHTGHTNQPDHNPHDRAWFALDDRRVLRFRDPRRFGRVSIVAPGVYGQVAPTLATLGPEPLTAEFDVATFASDLQRTRASIKAVLLGQRIVAGVGNIYADEALWRASIHPASRRVGPARAARLHTTIRDVLSEAVAREGTTFRDYQMLNGQSGRFAPQLAVYGKSGLPCQRCGALLRRTVIAQRGTTFCPQCQRA